MGENIKHVGENIKDAGKHVGENIKDAGKCTTNADEADMRMWRHVSQAKCNRVLVYSPDTDVYNIGIPMVAEMDLKEVVVQVKCSSIRIAHKRDKGTEE